MDAIETMTHNGYVITIHRDECSVNPRRDYDHLGTLYASNRWYTSRDGGWATAWNPEADDGIAIPVSYCYHDGTLAECSDDMADGYIYVTREKILREYSAKRIGPALRRRVIKVLEAELEEYNAYVVGDVFGYVIRDDSGHEIDSCWGFYGLDHCIESARYAVPDDAKIGTFSI